MRLTEEYKSILNEGAWVTFGQIAAALGTLIGIRLLTELLPPNVFGSVVLLTGIAALALGLASGPLMQAVLRYYPDYSKSSKIPALRRTVVKLLSRSTFWIGTVGISILAAYSWWTNTVPWIGVLLVALLAVDVARSLEATMLTAARRQRPMALWSIAEAWGRPLAAILVVIIVGASTSAVLASYLIASFLIFAIFIWLVPREGIHPDNDISFQGYESTEQNDSLLQSLLRYALPLIPLGLIGWISGQADRYLVAGMLGLEQAGVYVAVYAIVSRAFLLIGSAAEQTIRPVYQQAITNNNSMDSEIILRRWIGLMAAVSGIGVLCFILFHKEIANILLAKTYRSGSVLMPWIAAGYGLLLISQVFTRVCYAHSDTKAVLVTESSGAVISLVTVIVAIYHFGLIGAAYATPFYFGAQLIVSIWLARRVLTREAEQLTV